MPWYTSYSIPFWSFLWGVEPLTSVAITISPSDNASPQRAASCKAHQPSWSAQLTDAPKDKINSQRSKSWKNHGNDGNLATPPPPRNKALLRGLSTHRCPLIWALFLGGETWGPRSQWLTHSQYHDYQKSWRTGYCHPKRRPTYYTLYIYTGLYLYILQKKN